MFFSLKINRREGGDHLQARRKMNRLRKELVMAGFTGKEGEERGKFNGKDTVKGCCKIKKIKKKGESMCS